MLRTYDADMHLEGSFIDIEKQEDQNFFTLVVDNFSQDSTWDRVKDWVGKDPNRRAASRNPFNVGGIGSIFSNLDLIGSEWVADFHQDDRYSPDHLTEILKAIESLPSDSDIVGISSEMGSLSSLGKELATPPRASWFLDKTSSRVWFAVATLRLQIFPIPAATYRTSSLIRSEPPWLNSTFGDSEISIFLRAEGQLLWIPKRTMRFRENPESESHAIGSEDRMTGLELGFGRIVLSDWLVNDASRLSHPEFHDFFRYLVDSVQLRIGTSDVSNFILHSFFERVLLARSYDCGEAMQLLRSVYSSSDLSARTIESIVNGSECNPKVKTKKIPKDEGPETLQESSSAGSRNSSVSRKKMLRHYSIGASKVPHIILRSFWKLIPKKMRLLFLSRLWDLDG
jgi:hypothetical protein